MSDRSPKRKIIRGGQFTSKFAIGQRVQFDCDYNGTYKGVVIATTRTGVTIEVHQLGTQRFFGTVGGMGRYGIDCLDSEVEIWA
jgi:hypothetical protein